ncbi:hypothetical protein ACFY04_19790 [Streptomyces sp. NPDC001549]|uniref:hypothetical protein n=1 Tax=Streptomyces sp. NPDC001549 TaxID=3364586 RepID=UPI00367FF9B5
MRIATIIAAAAIAAFTSIIYIRHLSKAGRDRYIVPIFLNHGIITFWMEMAYGFVLGVSLVLLNHVLPLWASLAVFLAAVVPSAEVVRRRHNRRVGNLTISASDSDARSTWGPVRGPPPRPRAGGE